MLCWFDTRTIDYFAEKEKRARRHILLVLILHSLVPPASSYQCIRERESGTLRCTELSRPYCALLVTGAATEWRPCSASYHICMPPWHTQNHDHNTHDHTRSPQHANGLSTHSASEHTNRGSMSQDSLNMHIMDSGAPCELHDEMGIPVACVYCAGTTA